MPAAMPGFEGTLDWLLNAPVHDRSLEKGPDDPAERDANAAGLEAIASSAPFPSAFRRFIRDPEPRRHIRSATACYLDLAHFPVQLSDGGILVHFLSDQQWVLHWLLYVSSEGAEAVLASPDPLGFDDGENEPVHFVDIATAPHELTVCADSFEEFLYRFWAENELFFRLAVDEVSLDGLPAALRAYALAYPADEAQSTNRSRDLIYYGRPGSVGEHHAVAWARPCENGEASAPPVVPRPLACDGLRDAARGGPS
jgi:hypothetical protein